MIFNLNRFSDVEILSQGLNDRTKVLGITTGTFDLFHEMHRSFLERCRRKCDHLIVGVDSDDLVKQVKGPNRPVIPETARVSLVASLECVSAAFILSDLDELHSLFGLIEINVFFRNQDWKGKESSVIKGIFTEVVIIPDAVMSNSTTEIIRKILEKNSDPKRT